jgi:putative endonuclease
MSDRSERGRRGERAARRHLVRRGWTILAERWRGGGGELDIVAARGTTLIACEVKTRADPGALAEPLTPLQRTRIARALEAYVALHPGPEWRELRLDLITVAPGRLRARVRHRRGVVSLPDPTGGPRALRPAGRPPTGRSGGAGA